jgi:hypothetical protein
MNALRPYLKYVATNRISYKRKTTMCQICALAAVYQNRKKRDSLIFETKLSSTLFSKKLIEQVNVKARSTGKSQ